VFPVPAGFLEGEECGEGAVSGEELAGRSLLDYAPAGQDDDPVCVPGGGQAVGHGEDGRSVGLDVFTEGGSQGGVAGAVDDGGGFVEEQDARLVDQSPGEGEQLSLSGGQYGSGSAADVGQQRVVAVGRSGADPVAPRC
jgi:hypothetical protein